MGVRAFFNQIWGDCKDYTRIVVVHTCECIITLLALRLIIFTVNLLFTEKDIFVYYLELSSHISIIVIFIIETYYSIKKIHAERSGGH